MKSNFWQTLPNPFFVLAPMANVTDAVFRKIIAKYGKPDVMWTEFVSADGLVSPGQERLLIDLKFSAKEKPIVAQLFTSHPDIIFEASKLISKLGFNGLDINMGCPDRAVEKQGGGAALIKSPKIASEVIKAAREGVQNSIPVSVKTRLGYNKIDWDWIRHILAEKLPALIFHLRTRKEMSDVPAHWELMPEIIKLRNEISPETLIIGNGDVVSLDEAREKTKQYGCDGVMIGRGIFGTPWLFENLTAAAPSSASPYSSSFRSAQVEELAPPAVAAATSSKSPQEKLKIMLEHAKLFEKTFKGIKNFAVMKKHFKAYVSWWEGAKELRGELMGTNNAKEINKIVNFKIQMTNIK